MKIGIIIGAILIVAILAGGGYYRCFWQTVCLFNTKITLADHVYKIDRRAAGEVVRQYQPEKNIKTVWLWQKSDKEGHNRRQQTANKPLRMEMGWGREGKTLWQEASKEAKIRVQGEASGLYNRMTLWVNPDFADELWELNVNRALLEALRWHVGTDDWSEMAEVQLVREVEL